MTSVTRLSEDTIAEFALCDAGLLGIAWLERGRDLQLQLALADRRIAKLTCVWVSGVNIDMKCAPHRAGLPLSWECRFEKNGTQWHGFRVST